jgi:ATP-dependent DNA ligase
MLSHTSVATGKTKVWNAWIEGTTIVVEEGTPDAKTRTILESKNPEKELKSLRQKKIKLGYSDGEADPCAMLAHEWKRDDKPKDALVFPVYVQPKLDGIRCLVYQKNGQWVFQSRNHTVFQPFPHLETVLPKGYILDGELYKHDLDFQAITSIVRKKNHPDLSQLQYHVYDVITEGTFEERLKIISGLNGIVLTETKKVNSVEEIEEYHGKCVERGYEGIMIRNPKGLYKQTRSKDLLKYKHFKTEEYQVVGHTVGKGDIAIFECQTGTEADNKTFGVMMKATLEQKKEILENIHDYYGKWLTVKYQELSKDGIPRFPVGVGWRMGTKQDGFA